MKNFWNKYKYLIIIIAITLAAGYIRFNRLSVPQEPVFDEVYYPKWASEFLAGQTPYDVHPPLVKLLIAYSISLFGNTQWAWRFFSALLGTLLIPLTYLFTVKLFTRRAESRNSGNVVALIASFLIAFDGLFFVMSRTAIIEIFAVFFIVLTYYFFCGFIKSQSKYKPFWMIATGIAVGLAVSIKWTNIASWGFIVLWTLLSWQEIIPKNNRFSYYVLLFLCFFILPILIYFDIFYFWYHNTPDFFDKVADWHKQAFAFHLNLKDGHPYASRFWSWPLLIRPVWFYYQTRDGLIYGINALGNPAIWWPALIAFFWGFWHFIKTKNKELFFCFLAFLLSYLPWIAISRVQFNYYYLPSLFFSIIILAYFWSYYFNHYQKQIYLYLFIVLLLFAFFYPILADWGISAWYYNLHIWMRSWI